MSDLTDKQWEEYLAKSKRDVLWRAHGDLRSAQAAFIISGDQKLHDATALVAEELEAELKKLYGEVNDGTVHP
jgi:hypothetical protein